MESAAGGGGKKPHAVCVPFPAQGDITAILQLAKLLHARGFHITFVNTEYNHRRLLRSRGPYELDGVPSFTFASIPDGLPPSDNMDVTQDVAGLCQSISSTFLSHLLALLADLNDPDSGVPPVTCLVADGFMSFAYEAAKQLGVPCAALWTFNASALVGCRHYRMLVDSGLVPLQDEAQLTDGYLDAMVDGVPGMCEGVQLRDFPAYIRTTDISNNIKLNYFMREAERLSLADGVIFNTFDDLERPALDALRSVLPPPLYTVGPLCLHVRHAISTGGPLDGVGSNLWKEQDDVLEWLDGRAPRSVVYVNFGSIAVMASEQMTQFAWGLADSGYCFLWNVRRPGLVKGSEAADLRLPPELLAAVEEGRGKLSTWCPQEKVLQHEATGFFLTHSGWNSTMESISAGVPMLCRPIFADQPTNCRYVRTEWGNGMEIPPDVAVRRAELAAMIQDAMRGTKGRETRRRAQEWKEKAQVATLPGGSSIDNLVRLIEEVLHSNPEEEESRKTPRSIDHI